MAPPCAALLCFQWLAWKCGCLNLDEKKDPVQLNRGESIDVRELAKGLNWGRWPWCWKIKRGDCEKKWPIKEQQLWKPWHKGINWDWSIKVPGFLRLTFASFMIRGYQVLCAENSKSNTLCTTLYWLRSSQWPPKSKSHQGRGSICDGDSALEGRGW